MAAAIAMLTLGGILVFSALKGLKITEVMAGVTGDVLDPKGGRGGSFPSAGGGGGGADTGNYDMSGPDPKGTFKGPKANYLRRVTTTAQKRYNLRVSQICRPANAGYGAKNSLHKQCRAVDLVGKPSDMRAFALHVKGVGGYQELFYDPIGLSVPGFDHTTHVHVGA